MIRLHSPMSVEDCVRTLTADVDGPWDYLGDKPVIGEVSARRIMIRKRMPRFLHNGFQPHLSATLQSEQDGTSITGSFVMQPFVLFFVVFFATVVLSIGWVVTGSLAQILQPNPSAAAWVGFAAPLGVVTLTAAIALGGWLSSSSDKEFLLEFVEGRLQAVVREP